jgi:multisubunit Na+/H+ antiporter MnhE subunit
MICALAIFILSFSVELHQVALLLSSFLFFMTGLFCVFSKGSRNDCVTIMDILLSLVSAAAAGALLFFSFFTHYWTFNLIVAFLLLVVMLVCSIISSCLACKKAQKDRTSLQTQIRSLPTASTGDLQLPPTTSTTNAHHQVYHQPTYLTNLTNPPKEDLPPPYHIAIWM